jgi:lipopolysaccharide/colanic/teichoic acid biosynthesis glycosyltransferase
MVKEIVDRAGAFVGLVLLSPLLLVICILVWLEDGHSPFYVAYRAARCGRKFGMIKIRSMVADADLIGSNSTTADDQRITSVGRLIRKLKIDELSQLWNVLTGDMSLVGPRPQVMSEISTYTPEERALLSVKPGITDFASIVFADESEILKGADDPYLSYLRLIRPWKSQLGLFYVQHQSFVTDLRLIQLTLLRIVAPERSLGGVVQLLERGGASQELLDISRRRSPLKPAAVPGRKTPFGS